MNIIFVVNPKAGQGKSANKLINKIKKALAELETDAEIYITKSVGDAEKFVKDYCAKKGPGRFIACGGDGTLGEVLNGVMKFPEAEIGIIPCGTGNDFCRNFKNDTDFMSVIAQIKGHTAKCDVIKYVTDKKTGYCVNMFNIGFDCNVADMTATMKKKPFISGSISYLVSVFAMLIKKKGANLKIELDGETIHNGPLLLTSVANGSYCGGGVKSNPVASVKDGLININIVYNISRLNFLSKLPFYMKGTHVNLKGIDKVIYTTKCKKAIITPNNGKMRLCVDGEITDAGKTEFKIVPEAFNFVVPTKKIELPAIDKEPAISN